MTRVTAQLALCSTRRPALLPGIVLALITALAGCSRAENPSPTSEATVAAPKPATEVTQERQRRVMQRLNFADRADFDLAERGLIVRAERLRIEGGDDGPAWDMTPYEFIAGRAPDTVHPGLWRQAKLNSLHGLYEVTEGVYQVRGYDLSNISFIAGDTGWIVVDPLITAETASAALALINRELGPRPVTAVIYTHSHVDHFGGVRGVVDEADVRSGKVRIVAPDGFMAHAISENVLAGNAMSRRALYMFGRIVAPGPQGTVDTGLGRTVSRGTVTLIAPTDVVHSTPTSLTLDGLDFTFQNTPGAEAPAELMFYIPRYRAFCAAEEANATLHNLYTLRGAQVRSGKLWARWLDEAIVMFGDEMEVLFGSHHWPRWGQDAAVEYLSRQRDLYKYIHDQTLRMANQGHTSAEIAEQLTLPDSLALPWYNRGFYGSVKHNVKATYQLYLGWYDANPANLDPHPPKAAAERYVAFMGGAEQVLEKARAAFDAGDYRWVAEVVNHVVFAEPENQVARRLQADALEQMAYQAESGPWRNVYLSGAQELRQGIVPGAITQTTSADIVSALAPENLFDFLAVRLNGPEAADDDITLQLRFTDSGRDFHLAIANGVLNYRLDQLAEDPDVTLAMTRLDFIAMLSKRVEMTDLIAQDRARVEGSLLTLRRFGQLFDDFDLWFPIVTP